MATIAQSTPIQMNNNKRSSTSQARLDAFKKRKEMGQKWVSADVPQLSPQLATPSPKTDHTFQDVDLLKDIPTDVTMYKYRNSYRPKVYRSDDPRKKNLSFGLSPMVVQWSKLSSEGNLGEIIKRKDGTEVEITPDKARWYVKLHTGCPPELEKLFPTLVQEQEADFERLHKLFKEHMEVAFHSQDDASWNALKEGMEEDEFVKSGAHFFKTARDEDDDEFEVIQMARRLTDFQGNPNTPVFWKLCQNGGFEVIEPRFIPSGSLIQCSGTLRSYKIDSDKKCGVTLDFGRDIIVHWMPPKKDKTKKEEVDAPKPHAYPVLDFDY